MASHAHILHDAADARHFKAGGLQVGSVDFIASGDRFGVTGHRMELNMVSPSFKPAQAKRP